MTATINDALELVITHFKHLTDEDGEPYVMHCLRVMFGVTDPLTQQAAVMHDIVEDTAVTLEDLQRRGFCEEVLDAVNLLTHREQDSYAEYIVRLQKNERARQVKLADLRDNAAVNRVLYRESSLKDDITRVERYILSTQFLSDRLDEAEYRKRMARLETP